ncbi:hypothetical protein MSAN_02280500 [Mycena sanguinolenta]|uniref:DUF6589 domain-containing protein n=1 Tax=Mycena sanguinolenta TaxID=230812 RepID=A0A8H6XB54_9AGAR|nr:hypothetical protein MSAN_02280500 [Mycena sanguinolenta]
MRPYLVEFAREIVAEEMTVRRQESILSGIAAVSPEFMQNWNLEEAIDTTPFLTAILEAAAQTERAKLENKGKNPEKMCRVVTQQLTYQSSTNCLAFQAAFGLFLWSTGCARQTIDALFRCRLSVCYDSVLKHVELLAEHCMLDAIRAAENVHGFCYDNVNISTSIFVEQRGAGTPAKVQSGTFGLVYILRNAVPQHMLIAPIMKRFANTKGLDFNLDIKPSRNYLLSFHDQLIITVIRCLTTHIEGFEYVTKHPLLQHTTRRAIPAGYKITVFPTRATTTEEATVRDNLLYHDEIYTQQLGRTPESLSKYAIPSFNDQLTNARIRAAQLLRAKDLNAWSRREVFQLGFGLFHLCLNLVWAVLHVHRGSINQIGSLAYFFALMEKARLGNDQPDYHTLLAALTQILEGLLLNAWRRECGFDSFKAFAESKPSPEQLRNIAARILTDYATPTGAMNMECADAESDGDNDSEQSESDGVSEQPTSISTRMATVNPKDDIANHNIRLLTRDLLMIAVLVRAISDGDIGRVEVLFPHLAMMFRGSGCNKYCTELLHFIHNLKHVWTPEFANIMRDNMIICISGLGPGHCMAIDMNIEHLIGYLKILLWAKGMNSTWDRLGNISAAIIHLQQVKKKIATLLDTTYRSTSHTTPDTSEMVWRVQRTVASEGLQTFDPDRMKITRAKLTQDILIVGEAKLKSSTLATFNKKIAAMGEGHSFEEEEDEYPAMALGVSESADN